LKLFKEITIKTKIHHAKAMSSSANVSLKCGEHGNLLLKPLSTTLLIELLMGVDKQQLVQKA